MSKQTSKSTSKQWLVTVKHFGTRQTKVVVMPGGLHEAEARRCAVLKAGAYWQVMSVELKA